MKAGARSQGQDMWSCDVGMLQQRALELKSLTQRTFLKRLAVDIQSPFFKDTICERSSYETSVQWLHCAPASEPFCTRRPVVSRWCHAFRVLWAFLGLRPAWRGRSNRAERRLLAPSHTGSDPTRGPVLDWMCSNRWTLLSETSPLPTGQASSLLPSRGQEEPVDLLPPHGSLVLSLLLDHLVLHPIRTGHQQGQRAPF